ncbi:serum response factor isoform X5 [Xiphophorus maculatus]|uniref:serum response factor isoform X5 n=1 Tax=Xiphophorus maculatus TaxID=8083 RepID=UPI000C6D86B8|nr:serum response factor isoform X5 [Xiphophorus maculatus]XP_027863098.1 serum response factor isoform X5 [Xiphophorus couchianus]XP_032409465.1 serum response factor isoform X5 [Xiphophorus hellerii]
MLPSQVGSAPSGNGSASGRTATAHGPGIRPVLVRTGQALPGVGESGGAAGRQGEREAAGMLGANGPGGSRGARPGNGAGLNPLQTAVQGGIVGLNPGVVMPHGARFDPDRDSAPLCSGSDNDSDSGDEDDPVGSLGDSRRGVKRERGEMEGAAAGQELGVPPGGYGMVTGGVAGAKPGKKTRGRVKIKMEFIDNKLRRYTTFSKRKTGIMKKAYELSTLTGTQVLLLVASETGHVYTFATRKLQPMITSETGKALIQTCLNSPDSPPRSDPSMDQRMSATGFEETDLTYQVSESESMGDTKDTLKPAFTVANLPGTTSSTQSTVPTTSTTMQVSTGASFPITNYLAPVSTSSNISANGTVLKTAGASTGVMQLPSGFTFMSGVPQQLQAIQVHPNTQPNSNSDSSPEISHTSANSTATVSLPATIVTSSVPTSVPGHMMYPSPHTVMYASTPALADGGLAVLNAFSQGTQAMQVSHAHSQDTGAVPQVFLTAPPGTVQIPVSAVQLHPMVIGQQSSGSSSSNLTELQVVNLDTTQSTKGD